MISPPGKPGADRHAVRPRRRDTIRVVPETSYAQCGLVSIAYQVTGDGPFDLVFVPGTPSHVEFTWQVPVLRASRNPHSDDEAQAARGGCLPARGAPVSPAGGRGAFPRMPSGIEAFMVSL